MEDIVDLIATDSSASDITDKIKEVLYAKSAERIEALKPSIATPMFDGEQSTEKEQEE